MPTLLRTNYARNPNFETDANFWAVESGAVLVRDIVSPISGVASGKLNNGGDAYTTTTVIPGQTWTFSLDYKTAGTVVGTPQLYFTDLIAATVVVPLPLTQIAPARFSATITTTPGSTQLIAAIFGANIAGGDIRFDNISLDRYPTARSYFDGNTADTALKIYDWEGIANASASTESSVLPRQAAEYSADDLEFEFYSRQSGLIAGTLSDHKFYFYKNTLGVSGTLNDLEKAYFATKSGLAFSHTLNDHKAATYNGDRKYYYASFFS